MEQAYAVNVATSLNIWNPSLLALTWPQARMKRRNNAGANGDKAMSDIFLLNMKAWASDVQIENPKQRTPLLRAHRAPKSSRQRI